MVDKIRQLVATQITQNGNVGSWEEIRLLYSVYTYVSFLVIVLKSSDGKCDNIRERAVELGLEKKENLEFIFEYNGAVQLAEDVARIVEKEEQLNINALYQEFLSIDFTVCDRIVKFAGGKNSRDTLGSYYTQENFAYEIAKKSIEEYINNCPKVPEEISIADFSCGGGAFLIAAKKICDEKKIKAKLIGIDVDPIAVMIAKARLKCDGDGVKSDIKIVLGNPLLKKNNGSNSSEAFEMSLRGRYYNSCLGIEVDEHFDVEIGNPPWEKIRFEEKKFLAHYVQSKLIDTKKNRERIIEYELDENRKFYFDLLGDYKRAKTEIKNNREFNDTRNGELNTYALFTEYAINHMSNKGVVGLIVKSSLLKMPVYSQFMKNNMASKKLCEVYMFVNRKKIFNIDSREEFSIVIFKNQNEEELTLTVNLEDYQKFYEQDKIKVTRNMLELLNPETGMLPSIKNNEELKFLIHLYSNNPTFGDQYKDCRFGRLVHLTNHSQYILREMKEGYLPIYEGKFVELYTGKYATFKDMNESEKYKNKATARNIDNISGDEYPEARFFIKREIWTNLSKNFNDSYIIAWRSLTSATNRRTMLATVLPLLPTCQSIQILQVDETEKMIQILTLFNSIVFDYIVRLKMAGLDLTQTIVKQIPVPKEENFERSIIFQGRDTTLKIHILSRLMFLYFDDKRVCNLFDNDQNYEIVNKSRKQVIAELDCLVGYLYNLTAEEIIRIAESFDKYYTKEELEQWF